MNNVHVSAMGTNQTFNYMYNHPHQFSLFNFCSRETFLAWVWSYDVSACANMTAYGMTVHVLTPAHTIHTLTCSQERSRPLNPTDPASSAMSIESCLVNHVGHGGNVREQAGSGSGGSAGSGKELANKPSTGEHSVVVTDQVVFEVVSSAFLLSILVKCRALWGRAQCAIVTLSLLR